MGLGGGSFGTNYGKAGWRNFYDPLGLGFFGKTKNKVRDENYARDVEQANALASQAPSAPDPSAAAEKAEQEDIARRRKLAPTLLTSAQGLEEKAPTTKKSLLGA